MKKKILTETHQRAFTTVNCYDGCSHECLYCYAKADAAQKKRIAHSDWKNETLNMNKAYNKLKLISPNANGEPTSVMFPSTHDITPNTLEKSLEIMLEILRDGHELLIVSKPHLECVQVICDKLREFQDKILFRFTVGSLSDKTLKFWEPNTPCFGERLESLQYAYKKGYRTSVSCEPMLDANIEPLILEIARFVTDDIWLGIPNQLWSRLKRNGHEGNAEIQAKANELINLFSDEYICNLYSYVINKNESWVSKIKWKDTIINILARNGIDMEEKPIVNISEKFNPTGSLLSYNGRKSDALFDTWKLLRRKNSYKQVADIMTGSCLLSLNFMDFATDKFYINDISEYLIKLYMAMAETPFAEIIQHVENRVSEYGLAEANQTTRKKNIDNFIEKFNAEEIPRNLFDYIIMAQTTHKANWVIGTSGTFLGNVGKELADNLNDNITAMCNILQKNRAKIVFSHSCFTQWDFSILNSGDVVLIDSAYYLSPAKYGQKNMKHGIEGWTRNHEKQLYKLLARLHERGIYFIAYNALEKATDKNYLLDAFINKNDYVTSWDLTTEFNNHVDDTGLKEIVFFNEFCA